MMQGIKDNTRKTALFVMVLVISAILNMTMDLRVNNEHGQEISMLRKSLEESGYTALSMGQLMAEDSGAFFIATLAYPGGFGAVSFGSPEMALAFSRLPCVGILPKVGQVKVARTDVIVEESHE